MSEKSFREDISKLDYGESKEYVVQVISNVSASGRSEMFNVDVFRTGRRSPSAGTYKLQWTRGGKPELPKLNSEAGQKAKEKFRNMAYLTSGFGHGASSSYTRGIKDIEILVLVIKELKSLGIIIKI